MNITPGKYRMRDGNIASITHVNCGGEFPVRGIETNQPHGNSWTLFGKFMSGPGSSRYDLIERLPADTPDPGGEAYVMDELVRVIADAEERGFVVTVSQRPLLPLAMGHYETVPSLRPKRERAK